MEKIEKEKNIKTEKLWFKRKLYGWGWTPSAWQGWAVVATYVLIVVLSIKLLQSENPSFWNIFLCTTIILFSTLFLIRIAYLKGEKPKWQWGKRKED